MQVRLQKLISQAGITSRRKAETLITDGCVTVNGQIVTELGSKADPERDHVKVNGKLLHFQSPSIYLMLNKPAGFITTLNDPEGRPTVMNLVRNVKGRLYPVGRLDYHTEGLLLLTNDGALAHTLMHPSSGVMKRYHAKIKGVVEDDQIARLSRGVKLQDGTTAPCTIKKLQLNDKNSWLEVILHEGRYRQVRRMFESIGRFVIRLRRVGYAGLTLDDLPLGQYRRLTPKEIESLYRVVKGAAARSTSERPVDESSSRGQAVSGGRVADDRSGAQPVTRSSERPDRRPSQRPGYRPSERAARPAERSLERSGQRVGGRTARPSTTHPSDRPHPRRGGAAGWRERARPSPSTGAMGATSGRPASGSSSRSGRAASDGRRGKERPDHQKAQSGGPSHGRRGAARTHRPPDHRTAGTVGRPRRGGGEKRRGR
jgi:23S rRNA pseudouridine2605 synthase